MPIRHLRPALTMQQLKEIQERRSPADILPLLWEIRRLHILILRADQLQRSMHGGGVILETFRRELKGEPCLVQDQPNKNTVKMPPASFDPCWDDGED